MGARSWIANVSKGRISLDAATDLPEGDIELAVREPPFFQFHRLIFTVTDTELEELKNAAIERSLSFERCDGILGEYFDLGLVGLSRVCAVKTSEGPFGFKGSASRAIHWLQATGAGGIISVGMAFGADRNTQMFEDVLVSTHLLPYDHRTVKAKDRLPYTEYPKVQALPASRVLRAMMDREYERSGYRPFRIHRGALLSGGAKIQSSAYRDHLIAALSSRGQPIVGGEMEGVGLIAAAETAAWIVVKGIIDFADEQRDEEFKLYRNRACRNAAGFVLDAIRNESEPVPEVEAGP